MSDTPQQPGAGRAILEALARLGEQMTRLESKFDKLMASGSTALPGVASDADLDGQYGNPEVKKNPPRWQGESCVGRRYSECPVEFLDEMAGFQSWAAGKEDAKAAAESDEAAKKTAEKNAWYARQRAGYARGWAARLRAGWKPPQADEGHPTGPSWD